MTGDEVAVLVGIAQRHLQAAGQALNTIAAAMNAEASAPIDEGACPQCGAGRDRTRVAGMGGATNAYCLECRHEWTPKEG